MDITLWRKHIDAVIEDEGQWLGIADEDGWPLMDLNAVKSVNFPNNGLEPASAEVTVVTYPGDQLITELVGESLGVTDDEGRLVPAAGPARLLVLARDGVRRAGLITHTVVEGAGAPTLLTIHAVDLLDGLSWWPCPSIPGQWAQAEFSRWVTDASGVGYKQPREMAQLHFATRADGYTKQGAAVSVIRELVQDSFDAVNALFGWGDDAHAVVDFSPGGEASPVVTVRVNDDPVWDTVAEAARSAGVVVDVGLWWPGDGAVVVRGADRRSVRRVEFDHPVQVVRVVAREEA